jgi:hypothetical protein
LVGKVEILEVFRLMIVVSWIRSLGAEGIVFIWTVEEVGSDGTGKHRFGRVIRPYARDVPS